jgi:hypothetical protein
VFSSYLEFRAHDRHNPLDHTNYIPSQAFINKLTLIFDKKIYIMYFKNTYHKSSAISFYEYTMCNLYRGRVTDNTCSQLQGKSGVKCLSACIAGQINYYTVCRLLM